MNLVSFLWACTLLDQSSVVLHYLSVIIFIVLFVCVIGALNITDFLPFPLKQILNAVKQLCTMGQIPVNCTVLEQEMAKSQSCALKWDKWPCWDYGLCLRSKCEHLRASHFCLLPLEAHCASSREERGLDVVPAPAMSTVLFPHCQADCLHQLLNCCCCSSSQEIVAFFQSWWAGLHSGLFFAGQNIGLCNGKLKAMSGEELDQVAESELSSTVKNVMVLNTVSRLCSISTSIHLIPSCVFVFQISIFFRTSPKHKLKIIKVLKASQIHHKPCKNKAGGGPQEFCQWPGLPGQDQLQLDDQKTKAKALGLLTTI